MAFIIPIIKGGGTDVSDTTAIASDVLASEDFYLANGTKATGTIPTYAGSTEITENATLETEGKYLASDIVVNVSGGGGGYVRPTGAPNTDIIAANAPDIVDNGITYQPLYVLALMDTIASKTFSKTGSGVSTGGDAFVFSDEPSTLYVGDTTHTFDTTKDFTTSENWKARYVIVYGTQAHKESATGITVNLYAYRDTYECVGISGTIFSSTSLLFGNSSFASATQSIKYINIENSTIKDNTITPNYFSSYNQAVQTFKLPNNITTIVGNSAFLNLYSLSSINLPALTEITATNLTFGNWYSATSIDLSALTTLVYFNFNFLNYTRFITLATNFDIDGINLTGASGYPKSITWFHHLATQLKDNSGGTAKTMVLGATNIALIPSADATIISAKNWTLS